MIARYISFRLVFLIIPMLLTIGVSAASPQKFEFTYNCSYPVTDILSELATAWCPGAEAPEVALRALKEAGQMFSQKAPARKEEVLDTPSGKSVISQLVPLSCVLLLTVAPLNPHLQVHRGG